MDSSEIGTRLGTMLNGHNAYTPHQKGEATAEIVIYIRELEQRIAELEAVLNDIIGLPGDVFEMTADRRRVFIKREYIERAAALLPGRGD